MDEADRRDAALSVLHRYRLGQAGLAEDALAEIKAALSPVEYLVERENGERFLVPATRVTPVFKGRGETGRELFDADAYDLA